MLGVEPSFAPANMAVMRFLLSLACLVLALSLTAEPVRPVPEGIPNLVVIEGSGFTSAPMDSMEVLIPVQSRGADFQSALEANRSAVEALEARLVEAGVARDAVASFPFSFAENEAVLQAPGTQLVVSRLRVVVSDEDALGRLAGCLADTQYRPDGTRFFLSNEEDLRLEAFRTAMRDIQNQRRAYEEEFGVSLALLSVDPARIVRETSVSSVTKQKQVDFQSELVARFVVVDAPLPGKAGAK